MITIQQQRGEVRIMKFTTATELKDYFLGTKELNLEEVVAGSNNSQNKALSIEEIQAETNYLLDELGYVPVDVLA
jgi:hypothetical protein